MASSEQTNEEIERLRQEWARLRRETADEGAKADVVLHELAVARELARLRRRRR